MYSDYLPFMSVTFGFISVISPVLVMLSGMDFCFVNEWWTVPKLEDEKTKERITAIKLENILKII